MHFNGYPGRVQATLSLGLFIASTCAVYAAAPFIDQSTLGSYEYLGNMPRDSSPGEVFNYNTAETNLVGTLLRSAIGNNLATYLTEKIWRPFGMESDANWIAESTSPSKGNPGYGYLWWLHEDGNYSARGIFGQGIYINRKENVVIALHSARPVASNDSDKALQHALYFALTDALKD